MDRTREPALEEMGEQVVEDLAELGRAARARSAQVVEQVTAFVDEHPYASIGMAFGIGYLLSGALVSRATFKALGFGGRVFAGSLLKQLLAGGALGFLAPVLQQVAQERANQD
jgi:hypothetical protein